MQLNTIILRGFDMAKVTRKKQGRRKRSFGEKIWIAISILIAISMVLTTVASLLGTVGY